MAQAFRQEPNLTYVGGYGSAKVVYKIDTSL